MKECLTAGYPFVFGFTVYEGFESDAVAKTNSWGPGRGLGGYFTIPYAYLTDSNLSDDFWTVRLVAKTAAQLAAERAATVAAAKN